MANENEAVIVRVIAPLIVSSARELFCPGAGRLKELAEAADKKWCHTVALGKDSQPRPDFSVGIQAIAFTSDQLEKLNRAIACPPRATPEMYFPFLTVEGKCANGDLQAADRQNAHSASIAANALVQLYRAISRPDKLHREILCFSVSHDNTTVRIWGHYVLIDGAKTHFYRHLIHEYNIKYNNGRERWTAYMFIRSVYDMFVPIHLTRTHTAIDTLPSIPEDASEAPLSAKDDGESFDNPMPKKSKGKRKKGKAAKA